MAETERRGAHDPPTCVMERLTCQVLLTLLQHANKPFFVGEKQKITLAGMIHFTSDITPDEVYFFLGKPTMNVRLFNLVRDIRVGNSGFHFI